MKRFLKQVGTSALYNLGMLKGLKFHTRIIAFHRVNPKYFASQMGYLKQNYKVTRLSEAIKDLDAQQVVITFDDGYRNNFLAAYPVLKELGLPATIFVTCDFIEHNTFAWWDRVEHSGKTVDMGHIKRLPPQEAELVVKEITDLSHDSGKSKEHDFMGWPELKKITDVFEIGSHTLSHPILTNISLKEAEREIFMSKKRLEQKLRKKIACFAYPNGNCNTSLAAAVERAGYSCAVLYEKGENTSKTDRFQLYRRGININDNLQIFASKISGVL